ncbi:MAG: hypothetical protein AVDCRST_MAG29-1516, partial [uncultured Nocardioidaceae bacterium]
ECGAVGRCSDQRLVGAECRGRTALRGGRQASPPVDGYARARSLGSAGRRRGGSAAASPTGSGTQPSHGRPPTL